MNLFHQTLWQISASGNKHKTLYTLSLPTSLNIGGGGQKENKTEKIKEIDY
jgi:hypothetical protein